MVYSISSLTPHLRTENPVQLREAQIEVKADLGLQVDLKADTGHKVDKKSNPLTDVGDVTGTMKGTIVQHSKKHVTNAIKLGIMKDVVVS